MVRGCSAVNPMVKIKSLLTCCCLLVFLAAPVSAGEDEAPEKIVEKELASLKKSLFVPGWGQLAEKHYIEGAALLVAEIFCLYKVLANNHKGNENYGLYKEAPSVEEAIRLRELTETYDRRRNLFLLASAGVWAVNLIDIYVIVKNKDKTKDNIKIKIEHGENKRLVISVSFGF